MSPRKGRRPPVVSSREVVYRRTDRQGPLQRTLVELRRGQTLDDLTARGAVALATGINVDNIKVVDIKVVTGGGSR